MLIILIYIVFVKSILIIRSRMMKSGELMYVIVFKIYVALSQNFRLILIIPFQRHLIYFFYIHNPKSPYFNQCIKIG
ncbi:hypothetical protein A9297_08095 [Haemophilus parainfluenzae]|nr:hypothetical protein A9297_08095 [Haemophilus parainfluenzae]